MSTPLRSLALALLLACSPIAPLLAQPAPPESPPSPPATAPAPPSTLSTLRLPNLNNALLTELAAQVVIVHDTPGLGIAVVTKDGLHAFGVAGVRKSGAPDRLTTEDVFHIGSCSKMMTSALLLRLQQQGKLDLSAPLSKLFPDLTVTPALANVTLTDLLRHRSGIPSEEDSRQLPFLRAGAANPTASRAALTSRILTSSPPVPPPDSVKPGTFHYSNTGYAIAAHAAERATGTPFETLIQQELFAPLGITTAGFGAPGRAGAVEQPFGHVGRAAPVEIGPFADNPPGFAPAGTIHMSLRDWSRFTALLLGGGPEGFLTPQSLTALLTPPPGSIPNDESNPTYALGIGLTTLKGLPAYTHAGSNTMWFAQILVIPEHTAGTRTIPAWAILTATNHGGDPGQKATSEVLKELTALSK